MIAVFFLATLVASAVAMPQKEKVHFQPIPKAVPHEEPVHIGDKVPLLKQSPRFHKQIVTVVDEEPVIIKKPKHIIRENPVRVHYPVDKPFIQHKRIIKPIHKERTVVIKKPIEVPRPIVKEKTIGVPKPYIVHKPFKRVKTVTQVIERVHKIPKPIPKPHLKVVHRDRPFPVENLVIKKKPRVIELPFEQKVPIVETITNIRREPVAMPRDKVLTVDHPVLHHQQVPYFPKGAGGHQGGREPVSYEESQARAGSVGPIAVASGPSVIEGSVVGAGHAEGGDIGFGGAVVDGGFGAVQGGGDIGFGGHGGHGVGGGIGAVQGGGDIGFGGHGGHGVGGGIGAVQGGAIINAGIIGGDGKGFEQNVGFQQGYGQNIGYGQGYQDQGYGPFY